MNSSTNFFLISLFIASVTILSAGAACEDVVKSEKGKEKEKLTLAEQLAIEKARLVEARAFAKEYSVIGLEAMVKSLISDYENIISDDENIKRGLYKKRIGYTDAIDVIDQVLEQCNFVLHHLLDEWRIKERVKEELQTELTAIITMLVLRKNYFVCATASLCRSKHAQRRKSFVEMGICKAVPIT